MASSIVLTFNYHGNPLSKSLFLVNNNDQSPSSKGLSDDQSPFSEKSNIFPCGFKYGGKLRCFTEIPFSDNPFTPAHAQRRKSRLRFFMSLPNFSKVLEGPLRQLHNISEPLQDGLEKMLNLTIIYSVLPNVSFWTSSHP